MAYDEQLANRIHQAVGTGTTSPNTRCSVVSPFLYLGRMSCGISVVSRSESARPRTGEPNGNRIFMEHRRAVAGSSKHSAPTFCPVVYFGRLVSVGSPCSADLTVRG
jgi:hypothetical protein